MILKNLLILFALTSSFMGTNSKRNEIELTDLDTWKVWMDKDAEWQEDKLYLPGEFSLSDLPNNAPTCGWDELFTHKGKPCDMPTTIEEQFGTDQTWSYHGVSWFFTTVDVPEKWNGKEIFLEIEKYNHRVEIYVNNELAGYDAIGLLPYKCCLTGKLTYGGKNTLALRITSAGGNRGWEDYPMIKWGSEYIVPEKDYSGIGGNVTLTAVDRSYVEDLYVENLKPAGGNNIQVNIDIRSNEDRDTKATYNIKITEKKTGKVVYNKDFVTILQPGGNKTNRKITVPEARLWDEFNPNLYVCDVTLKTRYSRDCFSRTFGFRVFEVKEKEGRTHFYLNGRRIRLRSAIDWSVYAFNGLFPTDSVAWRNIQAVKSMGHNSLNFHRRAGDRRLFENADSMGVYIYQEPGGFHCGGQGCNIDTFRFAKAQMYERVRRLAIRDRNHPSLLIYSLSNEDNVWSHTRENAMRIIHGLDSTRLIVNTSGGNSGRFSDGGIAHIRPYDDEVRNDYYDHHTVQSGVVLDENDLDPLKSTGKIEHVSNDSTAITYWGEVRCYAGTFNYPLIYEQGARKNLGYDLGMYKSLAEKAGDIFRTSNIRGAEDGAITSVNDLTRYAGQGQYYTNGRLEQVIMTSDFSDGFAVNGWTPGPDMPDEWSSAMLDNNRNMNSYGENISYWNRPLQIAIMRTNGRYVNPGDTVRLNIFLINEAILQAGDYELGIKVKDGGGNLVKTISGIGVNVIGGDTYAQTISRGYEIVPEKEWLSGYITIEGTLYKDGKAVTDGKEQVLLQNRPSQSERFRNHRIAIINWPEAEKALKQAGIQTTGNTAGASAILLGTGSDKAAWASVLSAVEQGANLIMQIGEKDATSLLESGLINKPIEAWGGVQTPHWKGNGSSYIDTFCGDQVIYKSGILSTRSWEANRNPKGFYPFSSDHPTNIYGLYFAHQFSRNPNFNEETNLLVTYGEIEFGKGKILLDTSYWVDDNNAFTDLLFFNIIDHYCNR